MMKELALFVSFICLLSIAEGKLEKGSTFQVKVGSIKKNGEPKMRPVVQYTSGSEKGPVIIYLQGSIEKADVASELWSKNDRANLVNDGNFMLLMPVGATNEGLHNILDVLYGKQTEGGSFTDEDLQSPELKAIRERFDPSLPVMLYGSSKGCASMMKMIFSQGNDALTRMDQRLTNFACFSAQATVADVEKMGLKTPGILGDTVNKIYFFNCVNDKLVPFEGGRSGRRGPFVSVKDNAEIWAKAIGGSEIGPAQEKVKEPEGPTAITKESYLGGRVISWIYNNGEPISKEGHWCWREIENSYMKMAKLVE